MEMVCYRQKTPNRLNYHYCEARVSEWWRDISRRNILSDVGYGVRVLSRGRPGRRRQRAKHIGLISLQCELSQPVSLVRL